METARRRVIDSELVTVAAAHAAVVALASAQYLREKPDTEHGRGPYLTTLAQNAVDHALAGDDEVAFSRSIGVIALGKSLGVELPPPMHQRADAHLETIVEHVALMEPVWNVLAQEDIIHDGNRTRDRVVEREESSMDDESRKRFNDLTAVARKTFSIAWDVIWDLAVPPAKREINALHYRIGTDFALRKIAAKIRNGAPY